MQLPIFKIFLEPTIDFITFFFFFFFVHHRVRFHYGHPDVFDRLFHLTRGGVSKASKVINLSEDIFAGEKNALVFQIGCPQRDCNLWMENHMQDLILLFVEETSHIMSTFR